MEENHPCEDVGTLEGASNSDEPTPTSSRSLRLLGALDMVSDHVSITDPSGRIEYVNHAFERVSGRPKSWIVGRNIMEIWNEPPDPALTQRALREKKPSRGERVRRNVRGELFFDDVTVTPLLDQRGRVTHVLTTGRDTTRRHLADSITGLPSRQQLLDCILDRIQKGSASQATARFALIFLDVDHFKAVNDTYGKVVGDQLILELCRRIQESLPKSRGSGWVSHLNRDEFAILLLDLQNDDEVHLIANRILFRVREPFRVAGSELCLAASLGIASSSSCDYANPEDVLRDAETAMNRAKRSGGNSSAVFVPALHTEMVDRTRLGAELRRALAERELWLCYQPIVSLDTGAITGAEALVRWQHPTRGVVPPVEFIGAAEENGLIVPLGDYVLREACQQMKRWRSLSCGTVAVNVSARQLRHPDFASQVAEALKEADLPGRLLKLEVTESTAAHDPKAVTELLRSLKALDVELLMDDFGTGYSSLNYLTRFPLDKLKIDRSFVQLIPGSEHDALVATTIVAMAHSLGLGVIAEGVETRDQLHFLCSLGCEEMQGYLFSPPLKAADFEALVRSGRRLDVPEVTKPERVSLRLPVAAEAAVSGTHARAPVVKQA